MIVQRVFVVAVAGMVFVVVVCCPLPERVQEGKGRGVHIPHCKARKSRKAEPDSARDR